MIAERSTWFMICSLMMVANIEKAIFELCALCVTSNSNKAIKAHPICILMALALSPKKYVSGKFCFNFLKNVSICQRFSYIAATSTAVSSNYW